MYVFVDYLNYSAVEVYSNRKKERYMHLKTERKYSIWAVLLSSHWLRSDTVTKLKRQLKVNDYQPGMQLSLFCQC